MSEKKTPVRKSAPRVTAAQVDQKVDNLTEAVTALVGQIEWLKEGVGDMVREQATERAERRLAEANTLVEASKRSNKTPVGEREGDVIVRNLHRRHLRVRIGKDSDPYRINLSPRGMAGDSTQVPHTLTQDLHFKQNLNVSFEEISTEEYDAIRYSQSQPPVDPALARERTATLVTPEDSTVATMRDVTPEDRLTRIGPRYVDVPGSHNPSNHIEEFDRADSESDPEYRAWLRFKQQQRQERQQPAPERGYTMRDRINEAAKDPEGASLARYLTKLEQSGVLPAGELDKPVVVERATISVQPHNQGGL